MTARFGRRFVSAPALLLFVALLVMLMPGAARMSRAAQEASMQGDVNCSGTADSIDSLQILRSVAGLSTNAACLADAGDVNCDDAFNSVDSLRILRYVAGLPNTTPDGCIPIGDELGEQETGSAGQVHLTGASETAFNPLPSTVQLEVTGADLSPDPLDLAVLMNGAPLPASAYQVADNTISGIALADGANHLEFLAADGEGLLLSYETTLWAGSENVTVDIQDGNGGALNGATVTARLLDDSGIAATATSAGGQVQFQDLPQRTILLSASDGADGLAETDLDLGSQVSSGVSAAAGSTTTMRLTQRAVSITRLVLNDIDNTRLRFLSAAAHTYFGGNTRIHGTITIKGGPCDELKSLELEVWEGGDVVATAKLAESAKSRLLKPFPLSRKLEITSSELLFELPSGEAAKINTNADGSVILKARAKTTAGFETEFVFGAVPKLAHYTNSNRYGGRDSGLGGDDWVKPSVKQVVGHYGSNTWGDFSNMNGGQFAPHKTHQTGNDIDGHFGGYNNRDAATAAAIIGQLNDATYGSRIAKVFVTYDQTAGNPFWNAIKDVTLADGRAASSVIRPLANHDTHFHWLVSESGGGGGAARLAASNGAARDFAAAAAGNTCWAGTATSTTWWDNFGYGTGIATATFEGSWEAVDDRGWSETIDCETVLDEEIPCLPFYPTGNISWSWKSDIPGDPGCHESVTGQLAATVLPPPHNGLQIFVLQPDGQGQYRYWGSGYFEIPGWNQGPHCDNTINGGDRPDSFFSGEWDLYYGDEPSAITPDDDGGTCGMQAWSISSDATTIKGSCYDFNHSYNHLLYEWEFHYFGPQ